MKKRWMAVLLGTIGVTASLGLRFWTAQAQQPPETPVLLNVPVLFENEIPADFDQVEERARQMILEEIGVQVEFYPLLRPSFDTRRIAEIAMLEKMGIQFDLVHESVCTGEMMPLNQLLEEYGQGILELFLEYHPSFWETGTIYWLPSVSDYFSCRGVAMRTDIVEKYQIDLSQLKHLEDFTALFARLSTAEPGMRMISGYFANSAPFGRDTQDLNAIADTIFTVSGEDPFTVRNYYETDYYRSFCKTVHQWYEEGYLEPFMTLQNVRASQLVEAGVLFAYTCTYKPGIEAETSNQCKMPMSVVQMMEPVVTAHSQSINCWGISADCAHPKEAMQLLNLLYTDADLVNLLTYGLEGEHYQIRSDGTIEYPDGIDKNKAGYTNDAPWVLPNQYLSYPWIGTDRDVWQELKEFSLSAVPACTLNFHFDSTPVQRENDALNAIATRYAYGLGSGQLDPDLYLDEMLAEMEAAGLQKVLEEVQRQYTAWMGGK